jgi:hypothetical protein
MKRQRPGYYVGEQYFGFNIAQAQARAAHLTREYGRPVPLEYVASDGVKRPVESRKPA